MVSLSKDKIMKLVFEGLGVMEFLKGSTEFEFKPTKDQMFGVNVIVNFKEELNAKPNKFNNVSEIHVHYRDNFVAFESKLHNTGIGSCTLHTSDNIESIEVYVAHNKNENF